MTSPGTGDEQPSKRTEGVMNGASLMSKPDPAVKESANDVPAEEGKASETPNSSELGQKAPDGVNKKVEVKAEGEGDGDEEEENFDLQTDSLFAFNSLNYASIFGDIRTEQDGYDEFGDALPETGEVVVETAVPNSPAKQPAPAQAQANGFQHFGFAPQYPGSQQAGAGEDAPPVLDTPADPLPMFSNLSVSGGDEAAYTTPAVPGRQFPQHSKQHQHQQQQGVDEAAGYPYMVGGMGMGGMPNYPPQMYGDGYVANGAGFEGMGMGGMHQQMGMGMGHPQQMGMGMGMVHPGMGMGMQMVHPQMGYHQVMGDMDPYMSGSSQANSRSSSRSTSPSQYGLMMKDRSGRKPRRGMMMGYDERKRDSSSKVAISQIQTPQDLAYKVPMLSKDQNGCRFLQSLLDENHGHTEWIDTIYQQVFHSAAELMVDPFGNYLCQKLIEKCSDEQRVEFIEQVADSLVSISLNIHGTRAVQKLIDCVDKPDQIQMVSAALGSNVVPLVKDLNGNHVIQRCLQKFGATNSQFIFDAVARNLVDVATHRHGCCVLQRCIDHANETQKQLLVERIAEHALRLVQDPFGNYVVQYVLDLSASDPRATMAIVVKFLGSVPQLSTQKFSSNVIEKCLDMADHDVQMQFLMEIAAEGAVPVLLNDPYGNYVMQRALAVADDRMFELLCARIRPHIPSMRSTPYGKRIHNKLLKKFPMLAENNGRGMGAGAPVRHRNPQGGYPPQHMAQGHGMQGHSQMQAPPGHMNSLLMMNPGPHHQMGGMGMVQPIGMGLAQPMAQHTFMPYTAHGGSWA